MVSSFTMSATFPVPPEKLYQAWLSSKEHSAFTGSPAVTSAKKGGKFSAWDGYISGETVELKKNSKIIQRWRTTEFSDEDPDSLIEITLVKTKDGTKLTLAHSEIPKGQAAEYKKGWEDFYFAPMRDYFSKTPKK